MADLEKTVSIIFFGDDRVGKTISGISGNIDALGSKVTNATQPLADLADSAVKLEAALAALVAGGLALAINQAGEFGDSFAEISTLIDDSASNIGIFKEDILDYAQDSKKSITDINAAVYSAISAGVDYQKSLKVLDTAEKLSIAGKADLQSTLLLLVGTLNAYGASTDQAGKFADSFFQTVKLGQTTLPELAEGISQVSTIAAQLGIPIETVNAAIAALTKSGVQTSQAITQISGAFTALLKPSTQARDISKELGIEFGVAAIKSKGFETVLREVYDATGGNEELMAKLFGRVEGLRGALALGADTAGFFRGALDEMARSAGTTEAAYDKMVRNFSLINQNLVNNLQVTLIQIGEPLLGQYGDIANSISDIFKGLSIGIDQGAFQPVFDNLGQFSDRVVTFLNAVAQNIPEALENLDFTAFLNSINGLGKEVSDLFNAFFGNVDLTTPEGLAAAIQKLVDSGTALTNIVGAILDTFVPFVEALGDSIDKFNESGESVQDLVGEILGWGKVINIVASNIGILTGALTLLGTGLNTLALVHLVKATSGFSALTPAIGAANLALGALVKGAVAFGFGWTVGTVLYNNIPIVREMGDALGELAFNIVHFGDDSLIAKEKQAQYVEQLGKQRVEMVKVLEASGKLPSQKTTQVLVEGTQDYQDEFDSILAQIQSIPAEKTTDVNAKIETASFEKAKGIIIDILPDGTTVLVDARVDDTALKDAKDKLDQLPSEKLIEIRAQGEIDTEIARIKAQAETIQNAFEWNAKLDIAEVEANAEIITTLAEGWASAFESTGAVISDALGALTGTSGLERLHIEDLISAESRRRDEILANETKLTDAQVAYMNARTEAMQKGQGLVTIQAEGLAPELELVLHKIIELTQIRANEEGLEFLLGV